MIIKDFFIRNFLIAYIDRFDNKNKLSPLLVDINLCENSILNLNTYFYPKFIAKFINNKTVYFVVIVSLKNI